MMENELEKKIKDIQNYVRVNYGNEVCDEYEEELRWRIRGIVTAELEAYKKELVSDIRGMKHSTEMEMSDIVLNNALNDLIDLINSNKKGNDD